MSADAGTTNLPGALDADRIIWAKKVEKKWWRNAHEKAPEPLHFPMQLDGSAIRRSLSKRFTWALTRSPASGNRGWGEI